MKLEYLLDLCIERGNLKFMCYIGSDRSYALFVQPIGVQLSLCCNRCDASSTIGGKVMQEGTLGSAGKAVLFWCAYGNILLSCADACCPKLEGIV